MAEIIRKSLLGYNFLFVELIDRRTENWVFVAKPYQGLLLLGLYLMFVFKWGPNWMKNRPAFNLDKIIIAYNALQIVLCSLLFVKTLKYWGWGGKYRWICEPVDFSDSEDGMLVAKLSYCYFLLKIIDLLDTVFFVLRKKINQVSFLHVYHHTGMVMLIWAAVTYYPGGHATLVGVVNSLVHTVMYTYYLFSVIVPSVKDMVWAKRLVTQLQIIQFFIFVVHMSIIVFKTDCQYPRWTAAIFLPQNVFMLILFVDFYIRTYIRKPKQARNNDNEKSKKMDSSNGNSYSNGSCKLIKEQSSDIDNNKSENGTVSNGSMNKTDNNSKSIEHFAKNHYIEATLTARHTNRT